MKDSLSTSVGLLEEWRRVQALEPGSAEREARARLNMPPVATTPQQTSEAGTLPATLRAKLTKLRQVDPHAAEAIEKLWREQHSQ